MSLLQLVPPDEASGVVKENYRMFDELGFVPLPVQVFSPSEHLIEIRRQVLARRINHPELSREFFAFCRMIVSEELGYSYCVSFNVDLLRNMGISNDDQLGEILADPSKAPLPQNEKALLLFVLKAVTTPDLITADEVENLRSLDWKDGTILEAVDQGTDMVSLNTIAKAFKLDQIC